MNSKARKLVVGLVSVAAVVAIYTIYNRIGGTPDIDIDSHGDFTGPVSDTNAPEQVGKIGDVGIAVVEKAEYITRNEKTKRIEQVFGFESLIDEEANIWNVRKPYVHFYQPGFNCSVTADVGKVNVESAGDRHSLKGAKLTGGVAIHIEPEDGSHFKESFGYLNDLVFVSEKSHFSTAGPVRFVSEDLQMTGTGLELVYNPQRDRLEYFKMLHVDPIQVQTARSAVFGPSRSGADEREAAHDHTVARSEQPRPVGETKSEYYTLLFRKNVSIDTGDELVTAKDEISISDIFWPKDSHDETTDEAAPKATTPQGTRQDAETTAEPEHKREIVITCSNGLLLIPEDSTRSLNDFPTDPRGAGAEAILSATTESPNDSRRTTLKARKIDHSVDTGATHVTGPLELTFCPNEVVLSAAGKTETTAGPVRITANSAVFSPASNRAIFEGDCVCKTHQQENHIRREYTLRAPRITADLAQDETAGADINHLTADGGLVRLATLTKSANRTVGGVQLKCERFDYDRTTEEFFAAEGPGEMRIYNSEASDPNVQDPLRLSEPSWVIVRNFEKLTFSLSADRLVAKASPDDKLLVDYFPIDEEGKPLIEDHIRVTAGQVDIFLRKTADEQLEMSELFASAGVTYSDADLEFEGNKLSYADATSILIVEGSKSNPCILNGMPVARIELNLTTRELKADHIGPGTLGL